MAAIKPTLINVQPEREDTDESLRSERSNTDEALELARRSTEQTADDVVAHAREVADAVVDTARNKADEKLETNTAPASHHALAKERAVEDKVLERERSLADQSLEFERRRQAHTLANLLPVERKNTDAHLLTERVRADESVAHRDDFLGIVSHDLRNLLGNISIDVQLLQAASEQTAAPGPDAKTVARLSRISSCVQRMDRLINDLLDVVSLEAGELSLNFQSSDAISLVNEATEAFRHAAENKGVALRFETSEVALPASLDHNRMFQVLTNLIGNAIKFTESGGFVCVSAKRTAEDLHLSVIDSGTGIPEALLAEVFDRFKQVGKKDQGGLGLGLYISKRIVNAHGGRIWAESNRGGSTFHCTIPLARSADKKA